MDTVVDDNADDMSYADLREALYALRSRRVSVGRLLVADHVAGVSARARLSRTQAVRAALARELERRQAQLDASEGLCQVKITLKLIAETGQIRAVVWEEERLARS